MCVTIQYLVDVTTLKTNYNHLFYKASKKGVLDFICILRGTTRAYIPISSLV